MARIAAQVTRGLVRRARTAPPRHQGGDQHRDPGRHHRDHGDGDQGRHQRRQPGGAGRAAGVPAARGRRRARRRRGRVARIPEALPGTAPTSVARFHSTKTARPVAQNPSRPARRRRLGAERDRRRLVDDQLGADQPVQPRRPQQRGQPGAVHHVPGAEQHGGRGARHAVPPPPSTPTRANCEPPVNTSTDSAQVCTTDRPAACPEPRTTARTRRSPRPPTARPQHGGRA